ncbi:hypothetical protein PSACC_02040 [Paramicrosporidium saccamoebae]|uniref:Uncharacterized protein n=1 Tax=Paramicrosporidium saccamoebae TaxID=1246581 RepID=A0A2H9TK58_9FUNG|nr:hypothetical protein PSACC_02040 [Paramicrosporidium saccamoebae]
MSRAKPRPTASASCPKVHRDKLPRDPPQFVAGGGVSKGGGSVVPQKVADQWYPKRWRISGTPKGKQASAAPIP